MQAYHNSFYAMGTRFNAVFAFEDSGICETTFQLLRSEVLRIERRLNYFDAGSDISVINNNAFSKNMTLDDELFEIISACLNYWLLTNGAYDITSRFLSERENGNIYLNIPVDERIILNSETKTLRLKDENIKMDLGGFGKGYALERVKKILMASPIKDCLVSFGESSVLALGDHPAGKGWLIGVKDILNPAESVLKTELFNSSLSVSSNYITNGNDKPEYTGHIINPQSLYPSDEIKIAIARSTSPMQAEILSTAFINMTEKGIEALLDKLPGVNADIVNYSNNKPIIKNF
jgi:thiamine biosynthesis lipoprotein